MITTTTTPTLTPTVGGQREIQSETERDLCTEGRSRGTGRQEDRRTESQGEGEEE